MIIIEANKNRIKWLVIIIFIFAISWQLFLTLGIDFYGEDFDIFHIYWEKNAEFQIFKERYLPEYILPNQFTLTLGIGKEFVKRFFVPHRLFQIGFGSYSQVDRPYQFLVWDLLKIHLGTKVIFYRIFKAVIFAINTSVIFLLVSRVSVLLAVFGVFLYMTSAEIWLSSLYISHFGPLAQCGLILSVLLFIKLTEKSLLRHKDAWFYYLLILLVSNYSVLTTGDGRYLAIVFFLTILFFRAKELQLHVLPLTILFIMEFPILGYIKKLFVSSAFTPINMASHDFTNTSTLSSLFMAASHYKFPMNAIGYQLLLVFIFIISIHLIYLLINSIFKFFKKEISNSQALKSSKSLFKERAFLFLLWFICTLAMSAKVRSFRYGDDPIYFELYDLAYFIAPFIIFICYYIVFLRNRMSKVLRVIFLIIILCLMTFQVVSNINRLDKFRERCSENFCVWQNAKKFIEENSKNALVLTFTKNHYKPFVFFNSNSKALNTVDSCDQSQFCDLDFIDSKFKEGAYDDIFVLGRNKMEFRGKSDKIYLYQRKNIKGDCDDAYSRLKLVIDSQQSKYELSAYHFKIKS